MNMHRNEKPWRRLSGERPKPGGLPTSSWSRKKYWVQRYDRSLRSEASHCTLKYRLTSSVCVVCVWMPVSSDMDTLCRQIYIDISCDNQFSATILGLPLVPCPGIKWGRRESVMVCSLTFLLTRIQTMWCRGNNPFIHTNGHAVQLCWFSLCTPLSSFFKGHKPTKKYCWHSNSNIEIGHGWEARSPFCVSNIFLTRTALHLFSPSIPIH